VEVELAREGGDILVRIRDRAPDFDPRDAPPFDATVPLEVRRPGGMGIHLIRTLMDAMEHHPRAGGGNELVLRRSGRTAATGGNR
jgi:serine/threonine-protein kinase RsbW